MSFAEKEWFPESMYSTWLSDSLILMTSSLLFYHMVQQKSLSIDYRLSALFSVILILCSVGIGIVSLYPYFQRMGKILNTNDSEQSQKEKIYRTMYTIFGSIIILIQLLIAVFIVKGVISQNKKKS
jgi:cytochrome bd-type quinol oxidase subunit 2